MEQISKNRFLDALLKLFLISAIVHIIILFIISVKERNIVYLNYFDLMEITYFFKGIEQGFLSQIASIIVMIIIYIILYIFFTKRR